MQIDFHSHILPGIDDGSPNAATTSKMLDMEKKQGIETIVATPHFYMSEQSLGSFLENRAKAYETAAPLAAERGMELVCGAEVLFTPSLGDIDLKKLCVGKTNYLMIELPYAKLTDHFIRSFRSFAGNISSEITLILVHAERYLNFTSEESLYEIMNADMLVQLNSGSFKPFSKHLGFMYELLRHDMAHLLGTDCHNTGSRCPNMEIARKAISKKISPDCYEHLMRNAEIVLGGGSVSY